MERAIARGLTRIDFNGKTRNLAKWADSEIGYARLVVFNRRPWSRLLASLKDAAYVLSRAWAEPNLPAPDPKAAEEGPGDED